MKPITRLVLCAGWAITFCLVWNPASLSAPDTGPQPAPSGAGDTIVRASTPDGLFVHASKPYVLFMGADVAVESEKVFSPVEEVTPSVIVTKSDGKLVNVPLEQSVGLQVREDLKIAASSVGISDLKTERAYSKAADPFRKLEGFNTAAAGAAAVADLAQGTLLKAQTNYGANPKPGPSQGAELAELNADQAAVDSANTEAARESEMLPAVDAKQGEASGGGAYDAIRISFEVTPKKDMAKPYVAIIAQIQDPSGKSGNDQAWVHLQSLGPIAAGATSNVTVYQEGMPPGYALDKCEVHIYDGRDELATNLSSKRVLLSRDEMLDFRVIQYIAANNGRTLPAAPATFVSDLRSSLSPAQLNRACYVRVAKDGRVAATFSDKEGTQPLQDQTLDAALKGLRFKPAIDGGKPVESIVAIRLGMIASH